MIRIVNKELKILDFDIENRPLSYMGMDYTTAEVTAIAAGWSHKNKIHCWLLGQHDPEEMLQNFVDLYNEADIVTGHYIRKHDLPILNGALMEYQMPPLGKKLTSDTKMDMIKKKDMSASQESLAGMYELPHPKHHMSQPEWRLANRLSPEGIKQTKKRVIDDVAQHKALREIMIEHGALGRPQLWKPFS